MSSPIQKIGVQQPNVMTERDVLQIKNSTKKSGWIYPKLTKQGQAMFTKFLKNSLPILKNMRQLDHKCIFQDLITGLAEGVMAIPMGMSYALLAQVPAQYGIASGGVYPLIYLFLGTSPYVSVGVSALEAILTAEAVTAVLDANPSQDLRLQITITTSLCIGIIFIAMRLLRLQLLSNFLADPVMNGFSAASTILIITSQLPHLFGHPLPLSISRQMFSTPRSWWYYITSMHFTNWITVSITAFGILLLYLSHLLNHRIKVFKIFPFPGHLVTLVIMTVISLLAGFSNHGVPTIGYIPNGIPKPQLPSFKIPAGSGSSNIETLYMPIIRQSVILSLIFYVIHLSVAKSMQSHNVKQVSKLDSGKELIALGFANTIGSFFQCIPCATSFSRTALVCSIGSKSTLHNIPYSLITFLTLTVAMGLFFHLPFSALASIIIFSVCQSKPFTAAAYLFKTSVSDFTLWLLSFTLTVFVGPMEGIIISFGICLLWLLKKTAKPNIAILGALGNESTFRNVKNYPMAKTYSGIVIFRFEAAFSYCNADIFQKKVEKIASGPCKTIIVDACSITDIDTSAVSMLKKVNMNLRNQGKNLLFANWMGPKHEFLNRIDFYKDFDPEHFFMNLKDAVCWARYHLYLSAVNTGRQSVQEVPLFHSSTFKKTQKQEHIKSAEELPIAIDHDQNKQLQQDVHLRLGLADQDMSWDGLSAMSPGKIQMVNEFVNHRGESDWDIEECNLETFVTNKILWDGL